MTETVSAGSTHRSRNSATEDLQENLQKAGLHESREYQDIQAVVTRYVDQLRHGCGDSRCKESLCDTGRRNISQHPVRKYTVHSARAIAITIASAARPRARFCRYYVRKKNSERESKDRPIDPLSLMQQLSNTPSISTLCGQQPETTKGKATLTQSQRHLPHLDDGFAQWHRRLDIIERGQHPGTAEEISRVLCKCIYWLLARLPPVDIPSKEWQIAHVLTRYGTALKSNPEQTLDPHFNRHLPVLDALYYPPSRRLFVRALRLMEDGSGSYSAIPGEHGHEDSRRDTRDHREVIAARVVESIYGSEENSVHVGLTMVVLLKSVFLEHWDGEVTLSPTSVACAAAKVLGRIEDFLSRTCSSDSAISATTSIRVLFGLLDTVNVAETWLQQENAADGPRQPPFHLLSVPGLFHLGEKHTYFRMANHLRMTRAHSDAQEISTLCSLRRLPRDHSLQGRLSFLEEHYLLFNIRRGFPLQDAFSELWQRRRGELLRPLRVRLGEMDVFEIGHDLGGVQIEFFNLVCREMFNEASGMFMSDAATGLSYFRPASLQPLYTYELCGMLFGLALYNGITLPVNFPHAYYHRLLGGQATTTKQADEGWPTICRSLDSILEGDVADVEDVVPLEANGLRLSVIAPDIESSKNKQHRRVLEVVEVVRDVHHERSSEEKSQSHQKADDSHGLASTAVDIDSIADAWPGWHLIKALRDPTSLINKTTLAFTERYIHWLTYASIAPQWDAFAAGLFSIITPHTLSIFTPSQLRAILEGSTTLDLDALRAVTQYRGYAAEEPYMQSFWRVVRDWPPDKQRALFKFVTAAERLPAAGAGSVRFEIQAMVHGSVEALPTSSTCFGTLMLPRYASEEVLERKLGLAMEYGLEGFGNG